METKVSLVLKKAKRRRKREFVVTVITIASILLFVFWLTNFNMWWLIPTVSFLGIPLVRFLWVWNMREDKKGLYEKINPIYLQVSLVCSISFTLMGILLGIISEM